MQNDPSDERANNRRNATTFFAPSCASDLADAALSVPRAQNAASAESVVSSDAVADETDGIVDAGADFVAELIGDFFDS